MVEVLRSLVAGFLLLWSVGLYLAARAEEQQTARVLLNIFSLLLATSAFVVGGM